MTSPIMDHVDLCSGIGGFALGFEWAGLSRPVLFCDIEPWSRKVLRKHWPDVPIAEDVKELASDPDGLIPDTDPRRTILTAGYPCQSFSLAGKRRGTEDDRHIWPYIFSIIQARRPAVCVFENVYGHVTLGLDQVLSDLEGEGYATRPFIVPACAIDAPHRRDRLWIIGRNVAYANSDKHNREVAREPDETQRDEKQVRQKHRSPETCRTSNLRVSCDRYETTKTLADANIIDRGPSKNPDNPRGKHGGNPLATAVSMWPTPTVQDSHKATKKWRENHQNNLTAAVFNPEKLWPTPSASNAKGAVRDRFMGSKTYRSNLDEAVRTHKYDGQLNPQWVEWLMGYPEGWTDLED